MKLSAICLAFAALLTGCGDDQRVNQAVERAERAEAAASSAEADLRALRVRISMLELERAPSPAWVSAKDSAYGVADTIHGRFLVSVQSAEPYLNGFKIKLRLGNLTAATFAGAKATLHFGGSAPHDLQARLVENFRAGSWTDTTVVASPLAAAELERFSVDFSFDTVLLNKAP